MKIFLSPHCDDETLFGAYTIMREKPRVLVVTDGHAQQAKDKRLKFTAIDRRLETMEAMAMAGVEVDFFEISDIGFEENLAMFREILGSYEAEKVYAPIIEGGNPIHDLVGAIAGEMFENVEYYSTYTKHRPYPYAEIAIVPDEEERALKLKMLDCYKTQKNLNSVKLYFEYAKRKPEYRSLLCSLSKTAESS